VRRVVRGYLFTTAAALLVLGTIVGSAWSQNPTGVTTSPIVCPSTGQTIPAGTPGNQLDSLCPPASSSNSHAVNINPAVQGAANEIQNSISDAVANWLRGGDPNAKAAAAAAAAAEAEREQQEAEARRALAEQQRQAVFNRLSQELKLSGLAELYLKGFDNNSGLHLKGLGDPATNTPGDLQLKGFNDASSTAGNTMPSAPTPLGPQTCFFGECGPTDEGLLDPWNDPKVVDLRDLQQGLDLALVASKAPSADRQAIMDQALAAANGDTSIQVTIPGNTAPPEMSEQGLLAFQQANNIYRQAHNDAYQLQQTYQQIQQTQQAAAAIVTTTEQELENYLRQPIDEMKLEQKQFAMAQIYDAALQEELAYGKSWAQYLAARQRYYDDRYELEMYLWNTALGKLGNPPSLPGPLIASQSPPDSDLTLLLPLDAPTAIPTKGDLSFLRELQIQESAQPLDPISRKVLQELQQGQTEATINERIEEGAIANLDHQNEAERLVASQPPQTFPPNLMNEYSNNPNFHQQFDAERESITEAEQRSVQSAIQVADRQWQQKQSELQNQGLLQAGVPWAQQAQSNPHLAAEIAAAQKQVTVNLDYNVTRAEYEAQQQWQKWIEQQAVTLPQPQISNVGAVRD
jgi:hypothetical protein